MAEEHDDRARYMAAAHAMQSGVAMEHNFNPSPQDPKHLRVGINAAMVDHGGLVALLIAKGLITEAEYLEAIADKMEEEVTSYELRISEHLRAALETGLAITWRAIPNGLDPKSKSGKRAKYVCPTCDAAVWGKAGLNIACGDCELRMAPETMGNEED